MVQAVLSPLFSIIIQLIETCPYLSGTLALKAVGGAIPSIQKEAWLQELDDLCGAMLSVVESPHADVGFYLREGDRQRTEPVVQVLYW